MISAKHAKLNQYYETFLQMPFVCVLWGKSSRVLVIIVVGMFPAEATVGHCPLLREKSWEEQFFSES